MATILVVEDEALVARDLRDTLRGMGHQVPTTAASADEAMRAAVANPPELVLMDIHLRGQVDGVAAAATLRARWDPALVYLTAYADAETVKRASETEPEGYLLKPFNEAELRSTIEIALHKHAMARKLRESERWFKTALGAIGDAVITVDGERRVTFLNAVAEGLTGFSAAEALGRNIDEILPVERQDSTRSWLRTRAGLSVPIGETVAPIPGDGGKVLGAVIVFRDLRAQQAAQEQLALADRLSALGTLAKGVAHEVNNPLTYIASNAEYVLDVLSSIDPEQRSLGERQLREVKEALSDSMQGVERVRRIVTDLSAFVQGGARGGVESLEGCDVRAPIETALKMAGHELAARAQVACKFAEGLPRVDAPEARLAQVLLNLIVNAMQAMPGGARGKGLLRIETRLAEDGRVEVLVADDGAGMQPEVLRRIFEPFFTTRPVGTGAGLGLSLCHGIVTGLGGALLATSTPAVGTEFRLLLPVLRKSSIGKSSIARPGDASAARGSVLLVGDGQLFSDSLQRTMGEQFDVARTASAREALGRVGLGERFCAIVCDLDLHELSGERLYGELRSLDVAQAERVIFVCGPTPTPATRFFLHALRNARLEKPLVLDRLVSEVRSLVRLNAA